MSHRSSATVRKSKSFDKEINHYQKANRGKGAQPQMDGKADKPRKKKTVVRKVDPNADPEDILKELSKEEIEAVDKACVKAYGEDWVLSPDRFYKDSGKPPTGKFDNAKLANFEMIQALKLIEKDQGLAPGTLTKDYESPMPKVPSDALEKVPTLYPKTGLDVAIVKESQKAKEGQSTTEPKSLKAEPDIAEGPFEGRPTDETSEIEATRNTTEVSEAETGKETSSMMPVDQTPEQERENLDEPGKEVERSEKNDLIRESSLRKGSAPVSTPEKSRSSSRKGSQPVSAREKSASVAKTSTGTSGSEGATASTGKRGETETAKTENETASAAQQVDQKKESERDKLEEPGKGIEPSENNDLIKESSLRKGSAPVSATEKRQPSSRKGSQPVSVREKSASVAKTSESVAKTSTRTSVAKTSTRTSVAKPSTHASVAKTSESVAKASESVAKTSKSVAKASNQASVAKTSESAAKTSSRTSGSERSTASRRKRSGSASAAKQTASDRRPERSKDR